MIRYLAPLAEQVRAWDLGLKQKLLGVGLAMRG